jgi:NAD(P)-dependent dehydrogenase (short-subunit alcohol dehydrogenase family)
MASPKVAVVTGAGQGIGRGAALRLASDGCMVIAADIKGSRETVELIERDGGTAEDVELDVSQAQGWSDLVADVVSRHGAIDYLANIAGIAQFMAPDTIVDLTEAAWDNLMSVDLKGVWLGMRATIPGMISRGGGRIVNISSLAAERGMPIGASYTAAKAGVLGLSRQAAVQYGPYNILVNAISPGYIDTPLAVASGEGEGLNGAALSAFSVLGRSGQPSDIASLISFLFREGGFITGQAIGVDGGWGIRAMF